jgi:hypothetical protein
MKIALNHNVAIPRIPPFFPPSTVLEDAAAHIHPSVADIPAEADTRPAAVGAAHMLAGAVDRSLVAECSRQAAVHILAEAGQVGQVGRIGLEVVDHIGLVVADRIALEEAGHIGLVEGNHIGREHRSLVEERSSSHLCGHKMDRWLP